MSQTFIEDTRVPVTYIKAGPCVVTHVKSEKKDGYWSVQIGFEGRKEASISKPLKGHLRGVIKEKNAPRFLREVKLSKKPDLKVGDEILVSDVLKRGDLVRVKAVSKSKGFSGVIKRWGFAGGPRTHGQSDRQRAPGSIGQGTTPGRVWKGKKMAGRMGGKTIMIKNLIVVSVDHKSSEIALSGPIPGNRNDFVILEKIGSGKLKELVQETAQVQVQVEEQQSDEDVKESNEKGKEKEETQK